VPGCCAQHRRLTELHVCLGVGSKIMLLISKPGIGEPTNPTSVGMWPRNVAMNKEAFGLEMCSVAPTAKNPRREKGQEHGSRHRDMLEPTDRVNGRRSLMLLLLSLLSLPSFAHEPSRRQR
jgi:hypothetical protein